MIPVVWYSAHRPQVRPETQWDTALIRHLLTARPSPLQPWEFRDVAELDDEGAIVVVPGQHHHTPADVKVLRAGLAKMAWAVVMVVGDECSLFPPDAFDGLDNVSEWRMTPRQGVDYLPDTRFCEEGWPTGTIDRFASLRDEVRADLDVFFAGQVTHDERFALEDNIQDLEHLHVEWHPTGGFSQGMDRTDYLERLLATKVAPCPSGVCTQDSFRLYEALEAGCVPIVQTGAPDQPPDPEYWPRMSGIDPDDPPFPIIDSWDQLADTTDFALAGWPATANKAGAWWAGRKRSIALQLAEDLHRFAPPPQSAAADSITVLIPTSPIGEHPSTDLIERAVKSIRTQLPTSEILVLMDGVPSELEHLRDRYEVYQQRVLELARYEWEGVTPIRFDRHHHQAAMTVTALEQVVTPIVFFVEHDWVIEPMPDGDPLPPPPDWDGITAVILADQADLIRLSWDTRIEPLHRHLYDEEIDPAHTVPLLRSKQWSQRPHLASTAFYRRILTGLGGSHTMIEDFMAAVVSTAWRRQTNRQAWAAYRIYLYHPEGNISRIQHTDGRKGGPIVDSTYEYDGEPPAGAPRATRTR